MTVLVLSEGSLDVSRDPTGERLGAVRILARRALAHYGVNVPDAAIESGFFSRFHSGTTARGHKKRMQATLRDVDLSRKDVTAVVVVVDADGDGASRLRELKAGRDDAKSAGVMIATKSPVGVAVEMVEAWLLGDPNAVTQILDREEGGTNPEGHRDPKNQVLRPWIEEAGKDHRAVYDELAERADIEAVSGRCRSFKRFMKDVEEHS
ncbi:MAG: DUF4276 family protein [Planctomycetes bacterium]|nr:DUF4276 family protein [Planctomycetota bacterium]